jgi:Flp pilus assembly protein TadG
MHMTVSRSTIILSARALRRDRSGLALIEFAYTLPLILMLGVLGIETANLAVTNMRVSQIALNLADNASRVGERTALATQQLREVDINDVLQAVRLQGESLELTQRGRITLSSLEADNAGTQRIHWQRCIGRRSGLNYDSSYGTAPTNAGTQPGPSFAGTVMTDGMGPTGRRVRAPNNSGVMFVEINYDYQPIIDFYGIVPGRIHYTASFIVRDNRDFSQVFNPSPTAQRATCDLYTA